MKISCIYKIWSIKMPERFYIGSAVDFNKRKNEHLRQLLKNTHHSKFLQRHVRKYNLEDLNFSVLELVSEREKLIEKEQYYIDLMKPIFNTCKMAGNTLGVKPTKEVLEKLSNIRKGKTPWNKGISGVIKQSKETCEKRSQKLKGRVSPMKGRVQSEASKEKTRQSNYKRVYSHSTAIKHGDFIKNNINSKSQKQIAFELNVHKATISKIINQWKKKSAT